MNLIKARSAMSRVLQGVAQRFAPTPVASGGDGFWIQPQAKDRWLAPQISYYTPDTVEYLIRQAMLGDLTRQWELFDVMERTWPRLMGNLNKLKSKAQTIHWHVQPFALRGEKPTPEAQRRAALLEAALWSMDPDPLSDENDFDGILYDLLDAWGKGISIQEIQWEVTDRGLGQMVAPKATRWVHPRYYGYPASGDQPDRLMLRADVLSNPGSAATPAGASWTEFDRDRFLVAVSKHKSGHASGSSLLQPLGFYWAAANFSWEWFLNYAQLFGVPIRWCNYVRDAQPDVIAKIEAMLANMGSVGWAAFPEGTTMQLLEGKGGGVDNPQSGMIDRVDRICDILILGQTLTSDVGARGSGSKALGQVHAEVLGERERAVVKFAERTLNGQFVPAFCRLNFGDVREMPRVVPEIEDEQVNGETAAMFLQAQAAGVKIPKEFAYQELGIPIPDDGEEVLEPVAKVVPGIGGGPAGAPPEGDPKESETPPPTKAGAYKAKSILRYSWEVVKASDAQKKLADRIAEDVTGIEKKWLGGAKPWFAKLVTAAQDPGITDAEFQEILQARAANVPDELGALIDSQSLAEAMQANMGAAVVNGAVRSWMDYQAAITKAAGKRGAP